MHLSNSKYLLITVSVLLIYLTGFTQRGKSYNENYNIACHNCFDQRYAPNIEDPLNLVSAIEIDIWDNEVASGILGELIGNKMDFNWYVKHDPFHSGNLNCCGGNLEACLLRIKIWGDQHPEHDVKTIFLDKKENWSDDNEMRKPIDLDNLIIKVFAQNQVFSKIDFMLRNNRIDTVNMTHWPDLDSLKGKFIFVITDGSFNTTGRSVLKEYLDKRTIESICFVAPEIMQHGQIAKVPNFSVDNNEQTFFYNVKYENNSLSSFIHQSGRVVRVYGSPEDYSTILELKSQKVNFIALFNYALVKDIE